MATMKRLITRNNGDVIFLSTFYMNGWINDDDDADDDDEAFPSSALD